ncbi:MAG: SAM-dependent methyltransferase, partial [Planctomycetota bacterium]
GTACAAETPEEPLPGAGPEQTDEPGFPAALARFLPGGASDAWPRRIAIRPVQLREGLRWQFTLQFDDRDVHVNLPCDEAREACMGLLGRFYRDAHLFLPDEVVRLKFNRRGECRVGRSVRDSGSIAPPPRRPESGASAPAALEDASRAVAGESVPVPGAGRAAANGSGADASSVCVSPGDRSDPALAHDRQRTYVIPEGEPCAYLEALGVMTSSGRVRRAARKKFRQINRYLEFVRDVLPALPADRAVRIVDFGCGKSYLTFALYDLLHNRLGRDVSVIGIDRKASVVRTCRRLVEQLGWSGLRFVHGDAASFESGEPVDMVISLHACDTATDAALAQAIAWRASVILAAPCCRHEIAGQWDERTRPPLTRYGILRERLAAIVTDVLRALVLELCGYRTQVLEFVDLEHTPQNVLIRAVRRAKPASAGDRGELLRQYRATKEQWRIERFALERLLAEKGVPLAQPEEDPTKRREQA